MKEKQSHQPDPKVLRTKRSKQILFHIISPLEQAAMRHNYQPFVYKLDGARIYISARVCHHLAHLASKRAELIHSAVVEQHAAKKVPLKLREVFDDPRIILSLHHSIRNRFCKLECYTLLTIMQRGRAYFIEQHFGKRAMQTLDHLFEKYGCTRLFK